MIIVFVVCCLCILLITVYVGYREIKAMKPNRITVVPEDWPDWNWPLDESLQYRRNEYGPNARGDNGDFKKYLAEGWL